MSTAANFCPIIYEAFRSLWVRPNSDANFVDIGRSSRGKPTNSYNECTDILGTIFLTDLPDQSNEQLKRSTTVKLLFSIGECNNHRVIDTSISVFVSSA